MRRITKNPALAACWLMSSLAAQTQVDLRNQSKNVDLQTAPFTKPFKSGVVLPATCTLAEMFFETTAPAGANVFGCTATNTWSLQGNESGVNAVNGTARQIAANTVSGTVTLTLPSNLLFPGNVTFVAGTTGAPSFNVPSGVAPASPTAGDFWNLSGTLQYYSGSGIRSILVDNSSLNASNIGSGTLAKARIIGTAVFTDQSNTFSAGTQDFGSAIAVKIAHGPGYAPIASASIGYDDTANVYKFGVNGVSKIATTFSGSFSDNDCPKYQASTNSLISSGASCGSSGGALTIDSNGTVVGSRGTANFIPGAGILNVITDDGSKINIQQTVDSAVMLTRAGRQSGVDTFCKSATGDTSFTCSLTPTLAVYTGPLSSPPGSTCLVLFADTANTTTATLNVDALGVKNILNRSGGALSAGDVSANEPVGVCYDGAAFIVQK